MLMLVPLRKAVQHLGLHPNTLRKYADEGFGGANLAGANVKDAQFERDTGLTKSQESDLERRGSRIWGFRRL